MCKKLSDLGVLNGLDESTGEQSIFIWTKTTEEQSPIKIITIKRDNPQDNFKYIFEATDNRTHYIWITSDEPGSDTITDILSSFTLVETPKETNTDTPDETTDDSTDETTDESTDLPSEE